MRSLANHVEVFGSALTIYKCSIDAETTNFIDVLVRKKQTNITDLQLRGRQVGGYLSLWLASGLMDGLSPLSRSLLPRIVGLSKSLAILMWHQNNIFNHLVSLTLAITTDDEWIGVLGLLFSNAWSLEHIHLTESCPSRRIGPVTFASVPQLLRKTGTPKLTRLKSFVLRNVRWIDQAVEHLPRIALVDKLQKVSIYGGPQIDVPFDIANSMSLTELVLTNVKSMDDFNAFSGKMNPTLRLLYIHANHNQRYPSRSAIFRHQSTIRHLFLDIHDLINTKKSYLPIPHETLEEYVNGAYANDDDLLPDVDGRPVALPNTLDWYALVIDLDLIEFAVAINDFTASAISGYGGVRFLHLI